MPQPSARHLLLVCLAAALIGAAGCKDDSPARVQDQTDPVPDFALEDVNATSASYGLDVSPRDYLQKVSAWYFGHAT